jgi:hypothetical protein
MARLRATRGAYHLELDGIPLLLAPRADPKKVGREISGRMTPATAGEAFSPPIPREYAGFEAGMDYSRRLSSVPNGYSWGRNISTEGGVAMPAGRLHTITLSGLSQTMGEVTCGIAHANKLLFFGGRTAIVNVPANGDNAFEVARDLGSVESGFRAASCAVHLSDLYIGGQVAGSPGYLWKLTYAGTWSNASTVHGVGGAKRWRMDRFYRVDPATASGAETLIGTNGGSSFKFTTSADPLLEANWSATYQVGDGAYAINSIATTGETAWFCKDEGVFRVNRFGHAANVTPNWRDAIGGNGIASVIKNGTLYASVPKGIDSVRGLNGQVNPSGHIQPGAEIAAEHPVWGQPYAMTTDGDDLIAAFYNPSNLTSYICRGRARDETPGSPGIKRFIWHGAFRVIEGQKVTCLLVTSPFSRPRLWIWTIDATATVRGYWQVLPRAQTHYQEYLTANGIEWETDAAIYLGRDDWGQGHNSLKVLDRLSMVGEDLDGASYLRTYARADAGEYAQLGPSWTTDGYQTSKITTTTTGRLWDFRVDFTGTTTDPAILRSLIPRAEVSVEPVEMIQVPVIFGDGVERRPGHGTDNRNPETVWRRIQRLMGGAPLTLKDWYGRTLTVTLRQDASWIEGETKTDEQWSITALLTFTVKRRSWRWGDGTQYGSGESWGAA